MADLTITAANVAPGTNAIIKSGNAGETIAAGKAVYRNTSTGKWMLADNNSATSEAREAIGIALNGASNNQPIDVLTRGDITIGATMTAGVAYYLSDVAGGICPVADLATGEYPCLLGMAKSTTVLEVDVQFPGVSL